MKKLILFLTISISFLYAKESCYSVELISTKDTPFYKKRLLNIANKDQSCKMMKISSYLTVRCGCFSQYKEAKKHLTKFKKTYKDAYIGTTYKSRFDLGKPKKSDNIVPLKEKKDKPNYTKLLTTPKKTSKVKEAEEEIVLPPTKVPIVLEEKRSAPTSYIAIKEKKEKKISSIVLSKKKKKKKKKKFKYVKKREAKYRYQYYLKLLSNRRPIRKYGGYLYSFGAQASYDLGYVDQKPAQYSTTPQPYSNQKWRRLRVDHTGSFFNKKLFYEIELSFSNDDRYKDFYIGYKDKIGSSFYRVKVGNIKIPYSIQRYSSSKNLSFMERPLGDAFTISRKLGAELLLATKLQKNYLSLFLSKYTNSIDEIKQDEPRRDGYAIRGNYTFKSSKHHLFHIGLSFLQEDLYGEKLRYKQDSESKILEEKYVSTKIKDVKTRNVQTADILYLKNKYYLETGYMGSSVDTTAESYSFSSYFIEGSYFIIGEGKRFNAREAKFSSTKVTKDTSLELAFRYSYIDLNDKDEQGGTQKDYNLALNWYLTPEFKIMLNYILAQPASDEYDGNINIYQMRLLFAF